MSYKVYSGDRIPIKAWVEHVPVESEAITQLKNLSKLPFVYKWIAAMPDVHLGKGCSVGSVIATDRAIIPSCVSVDIGCGMVAAKLNLTANDLPENLHDLRLKIESQIPVGKNQHTRIDGHLVKYHIDKLNDGYKEISEHTKGTKVNFWQQLGTLGGGNHFIEICLDKQNNVWLMLHSGSRGIGNYIGTKFIDLAKQDMEKYFISLPDKDLSYLVEGTENFNNYVNCVNWAQDYAKHNRDYMLTLLFKCIKDYFGDKKNVQIIEEAINCHHNYVQKENHYDKNVWITRKGAVSAREGQLGIIPGSMGAKSFIVRGKGNTESFCSCSHGAGRKMSRNKAKELFTIDDHIKATLGVECRKDDGVIDETPMAYKNIDDVMKSQEDLVEVVAELKQILCIKG